MTASDSNFYGSAVTRILKFMLWLSCGGTVIEALWRGWRWGAGFAVGAGIAWINFLFLKRLTDAIGSTGGQQPRTRGAVFLGSRYLILGVIAYVILSFTSISTPAALTGLFVPLAAVFLEIVFELLYART
jgi:hypothetical protein